MNDLVFVLSIFTAIFFILGGIFFTIGHVKTRSQNMWDETTGVIIKKTNPPQIFKILFRNYDKQPDYYPTVQYIVNGITYEKTSDVYQSPGLPPGKEVSVLYNPDDPEQAVINTFIQRGTIFKLIGSILIGICILAIIIGIIYLI